MEKKHLRIIVRQDAEIICKHLCLLKTLTLLALLFEFCKWLLSISRFQLASERVIKLSLFPTLRLLKLLHGQTNRAPKLCTFDAFFALH